MYTKGTRNGTHGEENIVLKTDAFAPVVLLFEMGSAQTLHVPIGSLWYALDDPVALDVGVGEMSSCSSGSIAIAWSDQLAVQVVHGLNELAESFDEGRRRLVIIGHVSGKLLAVVVGILDVRSSESNALVDGVRVGLAILDGSVTLTLHNDTNGIIIGEVGTDAVRHTDNHLAGADVVLADRSESLEVSVREIGVTTFAVLDGGSGFTGIVGLGDEGLAATNATGILDDGVPGAQTSCVVEELHTSTTIMYMSKG